MSAAADGVMVEAIGAAEFHLERHGGRLVEERVPWLRGAEDAGVGVPAQVLQQLGDIRGRDSVGLLVALKEPDDCLGELEPHRVAIELVRARPRALAQSAGGTETVEETV